ncbi:choline dehydrogenase [Xylogone sp. PMI_703]|nr:choline dehydrogenase [Xylogone sp. PMI_703]
MPSVGLTASAIFALALSGLSNGYPQPGKRSTNTILPTYDYVVVGSGPGGGPLAARLAIAGYKVLLMDAGDDEGTTLTDEIPLLELTSTEFRPQEWDYFVQHYDNQTLQQMDSKFTWRLPNGEFFVGPNPPTGAIPLGVWYPRAGTLGGCSEHNALVATTPQNSDWDGIMSLTDDKSWASGNMRQFWERLEKCNYLPRGTPGHGFDGWFETSLADPTLFLNDSKASAIIHSAATVTLPSEGIFQAPIAVKQPSWQRGGPRDFILETANAVNPDGSRKYHLDMRLTSLVTKVRFSQSGSVPRAVGVDFMDGKSLYRADPRSGAASPSGTGSVNVTREVVISAGTFNTPQLLKLSGVGPAAELKRFRIPVVVDLPGVGTNLMDRYETTVVAESTGNFTLTDECTLLSTPTDPCLIRWTNNHNSPGIYSTNGVTVAMTLKSSAAAGDNDLFISGLPGLFRGYFPGYSRLAFADARHFSWVVLKAHSRNNNVGTVTLVSNDPRDTPNIHFRYLENGGDQDLQAVFDGMQFARDIFSNLTLDDTFSEVVPGPGIETEQATKDFITREAWGHHACCTAKIGADHDETAVLDSSFRVRGTTGLRVVDASVFPNIPGYFIVAAIYMISEKAADVIIADAKASPRPLPTLVPVFNYKLANCPGKSSIGLLVKFPPDGASPPHRHGGAAISVYVLEGTVLNKMNNDPTYVIEVGGTFHEAPGCHHRVSQNYSKSEPATILATMVVDTHVVEEGGYAALIKVDEEYRDIKLTP